MTYKKISDTNRTVVYDITVPKADIKKRYESALNEIAKDAEVEGFRKGKAPLEVVRKSISNEKVYDVMIQKLLPDLFRDLVKDEKLEPVIAPRVELVEAKDDSDWVIKMTVALKPEVKLPDYKKIVQDIRADMKKEDIWVPGKSAPDDKDDAKNLQKKEKFLNEILRKLLDETQLKISELILEQDINQRLARLVDDIRGIGLTMESYLQSRNTTQEKMKEDIKAEVLNTYKLEYALSEIADKENITVGEDEMNKLLKDVPEDQKEEAKKNMYVYTTMLRKQKVLDFLGSL